MRSSNSLPEEVTTSVLQTPVSAADHIQGDLHALVTLVEYGDYECPACGLAYPIVKAVQKHFGKRLCFGFRNFPLSQIHPNAQSAAETAEFAGTQERFWEMHDGLYENQGSLGMPLYLALAKALGLSRQALSQALESRTFKPKVRGDFMGGLKSGVNGTPTFFINAERHDAGLDFEDLVAAIETELVQGEMHT